MKRRLLSGFTLVELLLSIGIFAVLAAITSINFFSTYAQSNLSSATDVLIADIKTAQSNAMSGKDNLNWYFQKLSSTQYQISPASYTTTLPNGITISTTLSSDKLEFTRISGQVLGYITGQDTITLTNGTTSKTLRLNQYGTIIGE